MKGKDDSPSSVLSLSRYVRNPAMATDGDDNEAADAFQEAREGDKTRSVYSPDDKRAQRTHEFGIRMALAWAPSAATCCDS